VERLAVALAPRAAVLAVLLAPRAAVLAVLLAAALDRRAVALALRVVELAARDAWDAVVRAVTRAPDAAWPATRPPRVLACCTAFWARSAACSATLARSSARLRTVSIAACAAPSAAKPAPFTWSRMRAPPGFRSASPNRAQDESNVPADEPSVEQRGELP